MRCRSITDHTFDAYKWEGDAGTLPPWLSNVTIEHSDHHGALLVLEPYKVRAGRWVLRSDDRKIGVFPVTAELFDRHYTLDDEA